MGSAVRTRHRPPAYAASQLRLASRGKKQRRLPAEALAKVGCNRRRTARHRAASDGKPAGLCKARRAEGTLKYVYFLESVSDPSQTYTGLTDDLRTRLKKHNAGQSPHTSKYRPWRLLSYFAFSRDQVAVDFERYLKTGSGRAFAKKRLK